MEQQDLLLPDDQCEGEAHMIRAFLYHRLTEDRALARLKPLYVHEQVFRHHLDLLDRWGYTPITLKDYHLFRQNRLHLPRKPVIITVDDGSEETYRVIMPLMQEAGCKAVIFVPVEAVTRSNGVDHAGGGVRAMSPAQLRQLSAEGMEIGALSMTRQSLAQITRDEARSAIIVSKQRLEMILGEPVVSFAYPYGHVNEVLKSMVREAGYAFACAWSSGPLTFGDDLLEIRRPSISTGTGATGFALRLSTPFDLYEQCVRRTRSAFGRRNQPSAIG
jgi:peptidoglycan/xylan/chitin deacetylase (PgdA/CDA1 family)